MKRVRYEQAGVDVSQVLFSDRSSAATRGIRRTRLAQAIDEIKGPDLDDILDRRQPSDRRRNIASSLQFPPNLVKPRLLVHAITDSPRMFPGPTVFGMVARETAF